MQQVSQLQNGLNFTSGESDILNSEVTEGEFNQELSKQLEGTDGAAENKELADVLAMLISQGVDPEELTQEKLQKIKAAIAELNERGINLPQLLQTLQQLPQGQAVLQQLKLDPEQLPNLGLSPELSQKLLALKEGITALPKDVSDALTGLLNKGKSAVDLAGIQAMENDSDELLSTLFKKILSRQSTQANLGTAATEQNQAFTQQNLATITAPNNDTHQIPQAAILPSVKLDMAFTQPGWAQALADRVLWLGNQNIQGAQIQVNPPELGPVEIRLQSRHDGVTVVFASQHQVVRETLESQLPRLREFFQNNGVDLADVNVSDQSLSKELPFHAFEDGDFTQQQDDSFSDLGEAVLDNVIGETLLKPGLGLIDFYA